MTTAEQNLFRYPYRAVPRRAKPRGALRVARRIVQKSEKYTFEISAHDWFNYSHVHLDWDGLGDLGPQIRGLLLKAHCNVFRVQAQAIQASTVPCQLFMSVSVTDAGQDAVYIHSRNRFSEFPADFGHLTARVPLLENLLMSFLPGLQILAYRQDWNYIAFAPEIGVPLVSDRPNQALEPTTLLVTIPAAQEVAPSRVVAHL